MLTNDIERGAKIKIIAAADAQTSWISLTVACVERAWVRVAVKWRLSGIFTDLRKGWCLQKHPLAMFGGATHGTA